MKSIGLLLSSGGARGSYQAGALRALGQILKENQLEGIRNPFKIWSGASAGAINAAFCASSPQQSLSQSTEELSLLWADIQPQQVYRTDVLSLSRNSARWIRDLTLGSFSQKKRAQSLLDTSPLLHLLNKNISFSHLEKNIRSQFITSISCSAYSFNSNKTVSFVQGDSPDWQRSNRHSLKQTLSAEHILASCSIPLLFSPTEIDNQFYGDGGFRNMAPSASIIHQGAQKILMIGVRYQHPSAHTPPSHNKPPGVAKIAGSMLHALFFDTIDLDLERLNLINEIIQSLKSPIQTQRSDYSPIDYKLIRPSQDISKMAEACPKDGFPKMVQFLIDGLGSREDTADLSSYLMFHPSFTRPLMELGYRDTISQRYELESWILAD